MTHASMAGPLEGLGRWEGWRLRRLGQGVPTADDFAWDVADHAPLADEQVRVRHEAWSIDPYMRSRMRADPGYAPPQALGEVMLGATVGVVQESRHPEWPVGQQVLGFGGWQSHQVLGADGLSSLLRLPPGVPASLFFGALGMPGITAWYALEQVLRLTSRDRVWIDAAAGGVGLVACQWARRLGAEVVAVVGDEAKAAELRRLGFDPLVIGRHGSQASEITRRVLQRCPEGLTAMVEQVGGVWWEGALGACAPHARCALVGLAAGYDDTPVPLDANLLIARRVSVQAFIISEHRAWWPQARSELLSAYLEGSLQVLEDTMQGLRNAPFALARVVRGDNVGKMVLTAA